MDFITLAESSQRFLRNLQSDSSDDFTNLEGGAPLAIEQEQQMTPQYAANSVDVVQSRPLLSPSAEAELFLLSSNFLLYVAMIIIVTMIAKIYFPECLERRPGSNNGESNSTPTTPMSRSYSYRKVDEAEEANQNNQEPRDDEYLDSEDEEEELDVIDELNPQPPTAIGITKSTSLELEFDQETMPRSQVLKRLVFCSVMLNITFVLWGVLQERMLTRRYPRLTGEYFTYSYALVFSNRFWTLIMSGLLLLYLKPHRSRSTVIYEYSFPSISNMLSSWCQYEALRYVSFPATTLFKSFKLAPVMAMGKFLGNKTYPTYDYVVALVIGVGITMFMTSTDDLVFGYDIYGEASATWTGILLLFLFLFFDSFTSQWQSRMFQRHRDLSMVELMFATSAFSTVLSLVTLIHTKELYPAMSFVYRHSEIHFHFFAFSICSTIGQLFIFYTIKNFGAVVFTLIMTTRVLLSIALSCVLYDHIVTGVGFCGLVTVMCAVLYRIKRKAEGKQLLKWQGMLGDDKAHELVQEWHEHVDM